MHVKNPLGNSLFVNHNLESDELIARATSERMFIPSKSSRLEL
jgi:hypothetical protein